MWYATYRAMFSKWKEQRLSAADLSKKGSVDAPIVAVVDFINSLDEFCTTSSCSGRIVLFSEGNSITGGPVKKGCEWLFVSHDPVDLEQVRKSDGLISECITKYGKATDKTLLSGYLLAGKTGNIVLKFEAFVLHVQCRSLENAQLVHKAAVASGHRNSGITVGKNGKIIAAVRSTHGLEVPLSENERMFADREYLSFLVRTANAKMKENFNRIERFEKCFKESVSTMKDQLSSLKVATKHRGESKKPCKATQTEAQTVVELSNPEKGHEYSQDELLFDGFDRLEEVT